MTDDPNLRRRLELADSVLAAVGELPVEVGGLLAQALMLADGPLAFVGSAFDSLVGGSPALARLQLAYALRRVARDEALTLRLLEADSEPWRSLGRALEELSVAELKAMR